MNHNKNKKIYKNIELNFKKEEEQKKERSARFDDDKMELISVSSTESDYIFKFDDNHYKEDDDDSMDYSDSENEFDSKFPNKKIKMECDSVEFANSVTHTPQVTYKPKDDQVVEEHLMDFSVKIHSTKNKELQFNRHKKLHRCNQEICAKVHYIINAQGLHPRSATRIFKFGDTRQDIGHTRDY